MMIMIVMITIIIMTIIMIVMIMIIDHAHRAGWKEESTLRILGRTGDRAESRQDVRWTSS